MKKSLIILSLLAIFNISFGQLVTTDPGVPLTNLPVVITFNAALGSGGLAGYDGDVYTHTGVITNNSSSGSDWKYVKTDWGENTDETKLERIGQDLYQLNISPSIREYYGVPVSEQILQIALVFRSDVAVGGSYLEGKTDTGGDIFVDVYESGLNINIIQPEQYNVILAINDTLPLEIYANEATSISLYVDNELVKEVEGTTFTDSLIADEYGKYFVKAIASNATESVADSFYIHVRRPVTIETLPEGIRDGINYIDESTVILSIYAPYKEFIYVIGDFNDWQIDSVYYMKMIPENDRFWLEITDLIPGKEYIFQYFIDGEIKIADPYTDKISDPWNDKYISNITYPDLIEYPIGKTEGIAAVLQTNQEEFQWETTNFVPAKNTDLVIYETLIRDFTSKHSFQSLIDTLGYLDRLGVNVIELMPINEFEGNLSWGYNPSFYFAPDKYYGPKNDLKKFVDECHSRGIAVVIDLVLNHSYDQSPFVQMYFDGNKPTTENPWYNVNHNFTNPDAQWGNDFNHESEATQALVDSINHYWMSEYKIDGFRFDFTKGFGNNIKGSEDPWGGSYDADRIALLKRMSDKIWEVNPKAYVIFEHLADNSEEKVLANYNILLWGNITYNYYNSACGWFSNNKSDFSWISYKERNWNNPNVVGYMESHDEERIPYKLYSWGNESGSYSIKDTTTALKRIELNACFFFTIPGPKMIWQFEEMGYDYSINYNGRLGEKPDRWDYYDDYRRKYLYDVFSSLIDLRINNDAFESTNFNLAVSGELKKIRIYNSEMSVIVIGNFNVNEGTILPDFYHTGKWYDYFSGDSLDVSAITQSVQLQPGEYRIYTDKKLSTPDIGTGIDDEYYKPDLNLIGNIYPNPSNNDFNIDFNLAKTNQVSIRIFNLLGEEVKTITDSKLFHGAHSFKWDAMSNNNSEVKSGIYFCVIQIGDFSEVHKLILNQE